MFSYAHKPSASALETRVSTYCLKSFFLSPLSAFFLIVGKEMFFVILMKLVTIKGSTFSSVTAELPIRLTYFGVNVVT